MKIRAIRYIILSIILLLVIRLAFGFGKTSFEAFCPFGGVESLWGLFTEGEFSCALGPLNLSIFIAVIALTIIAKKVFCSWICPIGFLNELIRRVRENTFLRKMKTGQGLDKFLKLLRYPVLVLSLYFTYKTGELILRGYDPFYAIFSGFGHGTLGIVTLIVLILLLAGVFIVPMFFCRYFCPLGAVFDPFSRIGLIKITRKDETCTECKECEIVCPQSIAPYKYNSVRHRDCTNCLECIEACPEEETLELKIKL